MRLPSGRLGAKTWMMPMSELAKPATTMPKQNARNASRPRPARPIEVPTLNAKAAAPSMPTLDSDSDHGNPAQSGETSAAHRTSPRATSAVIWPRPVATDALPAEARIRRNRPHPTRAQAWFRNVEDGGRLNARSTGTASAKLAPIEEPGRRSGAWRTSEGGRRIVDMRATS